MLGMFLRVFFEKSRQCPEFAFGGRHLVIVYEQGIVFYPHTIYVSADIDGYSVGKGDGMSLVSLHFVYHERGIGGIEE